MSTATAAQTSPLVNGIDTEHVANLASKISEDDEYGKFKFRVINRWMHGSRSRTSIQGFYAGGKEDDSRNQALTVDADQPIFLAGKNTASNAVEHLLHSLISCLNTTLVYHAAVQGIPLEEVKISAEGDMNARGFFGISDQVNKGYECIRVQMHVKSDTDIDTLTALAMYSPVYEIISKAVPIEFKVAKI